MNKDEKNKANANANAKFKINFLYLLFIKYIIFIEKTGYEKISMGRYETLKRQN